MNHTVKNIDNLLITITVTNRNRGCRRLYRLLFINAVMKVVLDVLEGIFTAELIDMAFRKACHKRRKYGSNSDIWDLRLNWNSRKQKLCGELNNGTYRFDTVKEIRINGQVYEIWTSEDSVVIEALRILLKEKYRITGNCTSFHMKGRGGVKGALDKIRRNFNEYKYVLRTDVRKYYASIDHLKLFEIIRKYVTERNILLLLYSFLKRTACRDGYYKSITKGICRGSSLSPVFGALYLEELDTEMRNKSSFYVRYMDDIVILAKNRWTFRRNIKKVNGILEKLSLSKAVDKTFIGKTGRGFDFLGFHFGREGMSISRKSVEKFAENIVLKLKSRRESVSGKITPGNRTRICGNSGVYEAKQLKENKLKGVLSVPDTVSAYVYCWTLWVKSIYGRKEINEVSDSLPARRHRQSWVLRCG